MIQLCILFILAGFDKLDTDCGHGIADNITNHRWIDLRKASTMTWRFPSCAQCGVTEALIQILFRYQAQEDPVTFAAALGSSSALQQDCVMLPSCQLPFFFFLPPLPSSTSFPLPFFSTWDSIRQKLWHFIVKKGFRASRISQNFMGLQKETKSELTSRVFSAWHSAFWLRLSPFYSSMQCVVYQLTGCTVVLAELCSCSQAGFPSLLKHWWESSLETYTAVCSSCVFVC